MSARLPAVGTAIDVVLGSDLVAARCEGARGREIDLVVRGGRPPEASHVVLRWRGLRGLSSTRAEVRSVEKMPGRTSSRWRVRLVGAIEVVQRRDVARAFGTGPVALTAAGSRLAPVHDGTLLDISERSLRARIDSPALQPFDNVAVHVGLGDDVFELRGKVQRIETRPDGFAEVVVVYSAAETDAARIRRHVHVQQVRMRRAGLI
jgi:hypothetical protein